MLFFTGFFCAEKAYFYFFTRIPRGKELTEVEKAQIESLRAAGKSYSFIANPCIDPNDVLKILLPRVGIKKQSGRPKTFTQ